MTNQQAFEISVKHMLCAKGQSINSEGDCAYRGKHGRKCAIGVLIPDEQYHEEMEKRTVRYLVQNMHVDALLDIDLGLLRALQAQHDGTSTRNWPPSVESFKRIGETHNLDISFLE